VILNPWRFRFPVPQYTGSGSKGSPRVAESQLITLSTPSGSKTAIADNYSIRL